MDWGFFMVVTLEGWKKAFQSVDNNQLVYENLRWGGHWLPGSKVQALNPNFEHLPIKHESAALHLKRQT